MPTSAQIQRLKARYELLLREKVEVEIKGDTMYVFGSECACLRAFYLIKSGRVFYSEPRQSWVYARDVNLSGIE